MSKFILWKTFFTGVHNLQVCLRVCVFNVLSIEDLEELVLIVILLAQVNSMEDSFHRSQMFCLNLQNAVPNENILISLACIILSSVQHGFLWKAWSNTCLRKAKRGLQRDVDHKGAIRSDPA